MTDSSSSDRLPDAPSAPRGGEAFPQTTWLTDCCMSARRCRRWPVVDCIGRLDDGALKLLDTHCRLAKSMDSAARLLIRDNH